MTAHFLGGAPHRRRARRRRDRPVPPRLRPPRPARRRRRRRLGQPRREPRLTITAQGERAMSLWPNRGDADPRPPLGQALRPARPDRPAPPGRPRRGPRRPHASWRIMIVRDRRGVVTAELHGRRLAGCPAGRGEPFQTRIARVSCSVPRTQSGRRVEHQQPAVDRRQPEPAGGEHSQKMAVGEDHHVSVDAIDLVDRRGRRAPRPARLTRLPAPVPVKIVQPGTSTRISAVVRPSWSP